MEVKEGKKYISCKEVQDSIHKLLLELDEIMEDLKILEIPVSKKRERTRHFRDVMGMIYKLNGMDYEIYRGCENRECPWKAPALMVDNQVKETFKECMKIIDEADEFLEEYR